MFYREYIFHPTCTAMGIESDLVKSYGFSTLILGAAVAEKQVDLDTIEQCLVLGGRIPDSASIVKAAAEISLACYKGPADHELPLGERLKRIKFAYAAANGERRLNFGGAG